MSNNYRFRSEEYNKKPIYKTKYTVSKLRVRKEPDGEILKVLNEGAAVKVLKEENGWAELKDGTYVMSEFLK